MKKLMLFLTVQMMLNSLAMADASSVGLGLMLANGSSAFFLNLSWERNHSGNRVYTPLRVEVEGSVEDKVWTQLKTCFDPEIPVNIADLGLIYACNLSPLGKEEFHVDITMTLTAPGCGMGPVLAEDVKQKILSIPRIKQAEVEFVFEPPWDRSKMSEAAKLQLGLL